jgi:cell division septum initiation protein DivIVA
MSELGEIESLVEQGAPSRIKMIRALREAIGLSSYAMDESPSQVWEKTLEKARNLREALGAAERDVERVKASYDYMRDELMGIADSLTAERDAAAEELKKANSYWEYVEAQAIAEHDRIVAERDEAVKRAEAAEARLDRVKNACVCDELIAKLATLRGAVEAIFPWGDQPDNNGYDQCWCCQAYCEDKCTNPQCGAFMARAALASLDEVKE